MDKIVVAKDDWVMFADAVRDNQMIHRDLSKVGSGVVERLGVDREFSPGMYIASFIQGRPSIQSIKTIKFRPEMVYDGDVIDMDVLPNALGKSIDYKFSKNGEAVCEIFGVKTGGPDGKCPRDLKTIDFRYSTEIRSTDIACYLDSLGYKAKVGRPSMFLASQSGPALLALGAEKGIKGGFHATQGFNHHHSYEDGPLEIQVGNYVNRKAESGSLKTGALRWVQNDRVIASGRFSVGLLDSLSD